MEEGKIFPLLHDLVHIHISRKIKRNFTKSLLLCTKHSDSFSFSFSLLFQLKKCWWWLPCSFHDWNMTHKWQIWFRFDEQLQPMQISFLCFPFALSAFLLYPWKQSTWITYPSEVTAAFKLLGCPAFFAQVTFKWLWSHSSYPSVIY